MSAQETPTISVEELRHRLDEGESLTVLDIRPADEHDAWHVPDSRNVPAYADLQEGRPGPLADLDVDEEPVVTVCGRGAMAAKATEALREAGVDARTLDGGLRAWSTAWNTAETQIPGTGTTIVQIRRVGKGCLSYLIASEGRAIAVDPALDPQIFQAIAEERGWTIDTVLETHLHADHVSRAGPLAEATGARHLVPEGEPAVFEHEPVVDGDTIEVGSAQLEAIETPGHTPGSTCYLVDDQALLTGDTLFVNALGRPDLEAEGHEEERARALHASLERLLLLGEGTRVLPAHADRPLPFDGELESARLGELPERIELLGLDENTFVDVILERLPETPANHETIVANNRKGAWPDEDMTDLEAGANRCAAG